MRVLEEDALRQLLPEMALEEPREALHPLAGRKPARDVATIVVGAETDDALPAEVEPVLEMGEEVGLGGVWVRIRHELAAEVEAAYAARVCDGPELVVGEVSRVVADGAGVGVACREGTTRVRGSWSGLPRRDDARGGRGPRSPRRSGARRRRRCGAPPEPLPYGGRGR